MASSVFKFDPNSPTLNQFSSPRVPATRIGDFVGSSVTLVGETTSLEDDNTTVVIQCSVSDTIFKVTQVPVALTEGLTKLMEWQAKVLADGRLQYESYYPMNDDFDKEAYSKLVNLIGRHHAQMFWLQ